MGVDDTICQRWVKLWAVSNRRLSPADEPPRGFLGHAQPVLQPLHLLRVRNIRQAITEKTQWLRYRKLTIAGTDRPSFS